MLQIAAAGLVCAVLSLAVRSWRPEFSIYISVAGGLVLFGMIFTQLKEIIACVSGLFSQAGNAGVYFPVLLKVMGMAYLTDFSAQVCRDAGESGIASKVEMAGKVLIFYISLPVFTSLIQMLQTLLGVSGS